MEMNLWGLKLLNKYTVWRTDSPSRALIQYLYRDGDYKWPVHGPLSKDLHRIVNYYAYGMSIEQISKDDVIKPRTRERIRQILFKFIRENT